LTALTQALNEAAQAFMAFAQAVTEAMQQIVETIQQGMQASVDAVTQGIEAIVNATVDGLNEWLQIWGDAVNALLDYLEQLYPVFEAIGENFAISLANGMMQGAQYVFQAGQMLGFAAILGVLSGLGT
jgi:tetrahydromethanopterin S-methyltransferase subunit B